MKKTLITLLALSGLAMGETVTLALPASGQATASTCGATDIDHSAAVPDMAEFAVADPGLYIFAGKQSDVGNNGPEGTWVNTNNAGSITLAGRSGYGGTDMLLVIDGGENLVTGKTLTSLTMNTTAATSGANITYGIYLAVVDSEDNVVASAMGTSLSNKTNQEVTLSNISVDWQDGYKLMAGISTNQFGAYNNYGTVDGITLTANIIDTPAPTPGVPEPTTATLSLLALAGLAARRRRK